MEMRRMLYKHLGARKSFVLLKRRAEPAEGEYCFEDERKNTVKIECVSY